MSHRHQEHCPNCDSVYIGDFCPYCVIRDYITAARDDDAKLRNAEAEIDQLRAQVTSLQEHNNREVERRRKAEAALAAAQKELGNYAKHCAKLEHQLAEEFLVESPDLKAILLVLEQLRRAKLKYPHFADDLDQALDVLDRERDELAAAVLKDDIDGLHGVIAEAAQVGAVALRIIEMALAMQTAEVPA
ncbi:MAG: hypothetical protein KKF77_03585 [Proteobacteria bacterium]|nr:hypothetical protein [Pseudomonadota bacterium]